MINKNMIARFWSRGFKPSDPEKCWAWFGASGGNGYPKLKILDKAIEIHRVSYVIHFGAIPVGLEVMHICDNPRCTNPKHLKLGTHKENTLDRIQKGRDFKKLTEQQIREIRKRCAELESFSSIAIDYNITTSTVNKIKHYQRHKNI